MLREASIRGFIQFDRVVKFKIICVVIQLNGGGIVKRARGPTILRWPQNMYSIHVFGRLVIVALGLKILLDPSFERQLHR